MLSVLSLRKNGVPVSITFSVWLRNDVGVAEVYLYFLVYNQ